APSGPRRAPGPEEVPEDRTAKRLPQEVVPEDVLDVADVGEPGPVEALPAPHLLLDARVPILVVQGPLLFVREDLVRLADFLELLLRRRLSLRGHAVGMELHRELPVRALHVLRARVARDPEHLVVVL